MQIYLPPPPSSVGAVVLWAQSLIRTLTESFSSVVSARQAAPRVILQSPNGSLFTVTVGDDGTLQVDATPKGGYR